MKLISAEALEKDIEKLMTEEGDTFTMAALHFAEKLVDRQPEAVVRCMDCLDYGTYCMGFGDLGFCSEGRKKEGRSKRRC